MDPSYLDTILVQTTLTKGAIFSIWLAGELIQQLGPASGPISYEFGCKWIMHADKY